MPEKIFEQSLVSSRPGRKTWMVAVSFAGQTFLVFVLILIPLVYTDALPRVQLAGFLAAPPPAPPPPQPPQPVRRTEGVVRRKLDRNVLLAPTKIPSHVANIVEEDLSPLASGGVPGGLETLTADRLGSMMGTLPQSPVVAPPPTVQPPKAPAVPRQIKVGGQVQEANLIRKIQPVYPPLAKQARVEGVVRFTAIIGRDGDIQNLQLIAGHPLLVAAAREAVSQWKYKPTLLNDKPVEVVTQIDVNFTLTH